MTKGAGMKKRCLKKGHRERQRIFKIYRKPTECVRCVAELCERKELYCGRCGEILDRLDAYIYSYQSITLSLKDSLLLDSQGWIEA